MSAKWSAQMRREIDSGTKRIYYSEWLKDILSRPFDYTRYKEFWPKSYLMRTKPPDILVDNQNRFTNIKFQESEYSLNSVT